MKGVYQSGRMNCVAACVASVMELPLDAVPEFRHDCWAEDVAEWLAQYGGSIINIRLDAESEGKPVPAGYTLGGVAHLSNTFPDHWQHCVVCFNGYVVWCPIRGEMDGTQRAAEYTLIYLQNPAALMQLPYAQRVAELANELEQLDYSRPAGNEANP